MNPNNQATVKPTTSIYWHDPALLDSVDAIARSEQRSFSWMVLKLIEIGLKRYQESGAGKP